MTFLITGFEPFDGSPINPSEQAARALDGQTIGGTRIHSAILPVDCAAGPQALIAALRAHQPRAVLCLGEAGHRPALSIERVAVNLLDFRIPDNSGRQIIDQPVVPGGPAAYFVTLPARAVMRAVQAAGVPCELSMTAGTYLCNQVLYHLLHFIAQEGWTIPAGFIHMPPLPQEVAKTSPQKPSMALETILAGVRAAVEAILQEPSRAADV